jgi:four helix bundle protein
MEAAKTFKDLIVWQKAHILVLRVYKITSTFPKEELYELTSQFRRASVSIAANISEGFRKRTNTDKLRFYNMSQGSLDESIYYIILSYDLGYINNEQKNEIDECAEEVSRLLNSLYRSIAKQ